MATIATAVLRDGKFLVRQFYDGKIVDVDIVPMNISFHTVTLSDDPVPLVLPVVQAIWRDVDLGAWTETNNAQMRERTWRPGIARVGGAEGASTVRAAESLA